MLYFIMHTSPYPHDIGQYRNDILLYTLPKKFLSFLSNPVFSILFAHHIFYTPILEVYIFCQVQGNIFCKLNKHLQNNYPMIAHILGISISLTPHYLIYSLFKCSFFLATMMVNMKWITFSVKS